MLSIPTYEEFQGLNLEGEGVQLVAYSFDLVPGMAPVLMGWRKFTSASVKVMETLDDVEKHVTNGLAACAKGNLLPFCILHDGRVAGVISIKINPSELEGSLGTLIILPELRNKGIATRSGQRLVQWAFEDAGFECLKTNIVHENIFSQMWAHRLGFEIVYTEKNHTLCRDGVWRDMDFFRMEKISFEN